MEERQLTDRQRQVLDGLLAGKSARQIGDELRITRNAVYQVLNRLRDLGVLPKSFTPTGVPPRRQEQAAVASRSAPPVHSRLWQLRNLDADSSEYFDLLTAAVAEGDVPSLAYELGRGDMGGWDEASEKIVESALRRLGVLPNGAAQTDS